MRIAIISDIHGNLPALEAVLKDISTERPDAIICLGDLAFKGPAPSECIARIRELGIPCVHGNTDLFLLALAKVQPTRPLPVAWAPNEAERHHFQWHVDQLSAADLDYLANLPFEHRLVISDQSLLFVHATPQDCIATIQPTHSPDAINQRLDKIGANWLLMGHIHRPFMFRQAGISLVNTGAIGFSLDGDWRASYVLIEPKRGAVHHKRVSYDIDAVVALARERGFVYDPTWYGETLLKGHWA